MKALPFVELVLQRSTGDCGIAALAMLLGLPYEDVFAALVTPTYPKPHRVGLMTRHVKQAAKRLGVSLALRRVWDLDESTGLLTVERNTPDAEQFKQHLVLLKFGLVFDTDGKAWEPETYFAQHDFKPVSLLTAEEN